MVFQLPLTRLNAPRRCIAHADRDLRGRTAGNTRARAVRHGHARPIVQSCTRAAQQDRASARAPAHECSRARPA